MKSKKAQAFNIGVIMVVFISILVGVIFFQTIAQESGTSTNLATIVQENIGNATNGTAIYLDYRSLSNVIIMNGTATGGTVVAAGNYTITNNVIDPSDGTLSVSILPKAVFGLYSKTWYMNATAQRTTYIPDSGGRAIVGLIAIFFALAVIVVALEPTLRSGVLDMINR